MSFADLPARRQVNDIWMCLFLLSRRGREEHTVQYKSWLHAFVISLPLLLMTSEATALTISIDPLHTFLFTNNDPWSGNGSVAGATPIVLGDIGLSGGDLIQLEKLGDWYDGYAAHTDVDVAALDVMTEMVGVFSSNELLAPNVLARVPGAVGAGSEYTTWNTLFDNLSTDVYGDFRIDNTFLYVPFGATHLFVAAHDIYYSDNSEPDGDYAVRITKTASVPEPSTLLFLASALRPLAYSQEPSPLAIDTLESVTEGLQTHLKRCSAKTDLPRCLLP